MWSVGVLVTEAACQSAGQEAGIRDKQLHQVAEGLPGQVHQPGAGRQRRGDLLLLLCSRRLP